MMIKVKLLIKLTVLNSYFLIYIWLAIYLFYLMQKINVNMKTKQRSMHHFFFFLFSFEMWGVFIFNLFYFERGGKESSSS